MTTSQVQPSIQAGVSRWHNGHLMKFLVTSEETNGVFSLVQMTLRQGCEPPNHIHEHEDELFYVQEGVIRFSINDRIIEAKAGDTVFMPRLIAHAFEIVTPTAKALVYLTPGYFEGFFYELSEEALGDVLPPAPVGPPPAPVLNRIMETSTRYGLQYM